VSPRRRVDWAEGQEYLLRSGYQYQATPERYAEVARELLRRRAQMQRTAVRELALDLLDGVAAFGFPLPFELVELLRLELAVKPTGVTTKPEYQKALAIKRANPGISVRALAEKAGVPWPTIARWQRQPYWKIAVSLK
jgi:hypothetical protein